MHLSYIVQEPFSNFGRTLEETLLALRAARHAQRRGFSALGEFGAIQSWLELVPGKAVDYQGSQNIWVARTDREDITNRHPNFVQYFNAAQAMSLEIDAIANEPEAAGVWGVEHSKKQVLVKTLQDVAALYEPDDWVWEDQPPSRKRSPARQNAFFYAVDTANSIVEDAYPKEIGPMLATAKANIAARVKAQTDARVAVETTKRDEAVATGNVTAQKRAETAISKVEAQKEEIFAALDLQKIQKAITGTKILGIPVAIFVPVVLALGAGAFYFYRRRRTAPKVAMSRYR